MATRSLLVVLQVTVFLLTLCLLQDASLDCNSSDSLTISKVAAIFTLTGIAAQNIALLISCFSGKNVNAANVILPMVMMAQIVFSAAVSAPYKVENRDGYRSVNDDRTKEENDWIRCPSLHEFTISWHADILLRNVVTDWNENQSDSVKRIRQDFWPSMAWLLCCILVSFLISLLSLSWQTSIQNQLKLIFNWVPKLER